MFLNNQFFYDFVHAQNNEFVNEHVSFIIGDNLPYESILYFKAYNDLDFNQVSFINGHSEVTLNKEHIILEIDVNTKLSTFIPNEFYNQYYLELQNYVDSILENLAYEDLFQYIKSITPNYEVSDFNSWDVADYEKHLNYLKEAWKKLENLEKTPLNNLDVEYPFFIDFINNNNIKLTSTTRMSIQFHEESIDYNLEIAGIIPSDNETLYFNETMYPLLSTRSNQLYTYIFSIIPKEKALIKNFVQTHYNKTSPNYILHNEAVAVLDNANDTIVFLAEIFLYVGLGFLIFAAVLLFNFISLSVTNKKQEIGILRALGASNGDVVKIFFLEATIIALINFLIATIISFFAIITINDYLKTNFGLIISIITFGIRQLIIMLLISLLIAYLSSSIPVRRIAKKNPIDSIRER